MIPRLKRAIPNEQFQMILEFEDAQTRILAMSVLHTEKGWRALAYPAAMKRFRLSPDGIDWPEGGMADVAYLYDKSTPIDRRQLEHQVLRLAYRNQAPTPEDASHHVFGVYLAPYSDKPFRVGESIGGGHGERGGGRDYSLDELLAWPKWRSHFTLSGCSWAATLVEALAGDQPRLIDRLIEEACARNGMAEGIGT